MDLAHAQDRLAAKLFATAAVLALTITFAVRSVRRDAPYMMVNELVVKNLGKYLGERVRVHGWVRPGSIEHAGDDHRFVLSGQGAAVRVHYRGAWPERLREQSELVVHATLGFDGDGWLLESRDLSMRCDIRYGDSDRKLDTVYK